MMKNNKRKTQSGYAEINMQDLAKRLVMGEESPTDTEIREPNKQVNRLTQ